jgi:hypothetical protein
MSQSGKAHWNWGKHLSDGTKELIRGSKACVPFTRLHKKHLKEARLKYLEEQKRRKHGKQKNR